MLALREQWPDGIPADVMRNWTYQAAHHTLATLANPMDIHHVLISGGRVYISRKLDGFVPFMVPSLLDVLKIAPETLDVEFILNWGDYHRATTQAHAARIPLISYVKPVDQSSVHEWDLLVPCYYDGMIDRICQAAYSEEGDTEPLPAWEERKSVVFGSYGYHCPVAPESLQHPLADYENKLLPKCPRKFYWQLSRANKDLMDIRLQAKEEKLRGDHAEGGTAVPLFAHAQYKYLLDTDGIGRSCRFEELLALGSVVLKAQSRLIGHFSDALIPGHHYLPVFSSSMNDVLSAHAWLEAHPDEARAIARRQQFACSKLRKQGRSCTWKAVLEGCARCCSTCRRRTSGRGSRRCGASTSSAPRSRARPWRAAPSRSTALAARAAGSSGRARRARRPCWPCRSCSRRRRWTTCASGRRSARSSGSRRVCDALGESREAGEPRRAGGAGGAGEAEARGRLMMRA